MGLFGVGGVVGDALDFGANMVTGGAYGNQQATLQTNAAQMELAQKQMDFQERMSNSAYQRVTADMRAAGINPMLAIDNGGASTPSGAMAQLTAPRPGDIGKGLVDTAAKALSGSADYKKTNSETDLNTKQAQVAETQRDKNLANADESRANKEYTSQLASKAEADTRSSEARAEMAERDNEISKARYDIDKALAPYDAGLERVQQAIGSAGSAFRSFMSGKKGSGYQKGNQDGFRDGYERGTRAGTPVD